MKDLRKTDNFIDNKFTTFEKPSSRKITNSMSFQKTETWTLSPSSVSWLLEFEE